LAKKLSFDNQFVNILRR